MPRTTDKNSKLNLLFNTIGLPVQAIVGPLIKYAPPQVKLIIVVVMTVIIIFTLIILGIGFAQISGVGELPQSKAGVKNILLNGSVVLEVPYFNQFVDTTGAINPRTGWQMCGAASAVMVLGYYKKLNFTNGSDLKQYMYQDKGQNLPIY